MSDNKLRWIHLSDLHNNYKSYDTIAMRNNLRSYLKELCEKTKYDFIIITGDITYQFGKFDDQLIERLIDICNIEKENIYLVPGNHDIKRGTVRDAVIQSIRDNVDVKDIYTYTLDKEYLDILKKGENKFLKYYKDNISGEKFDYKKLHRIIRRDKYNIICMNTCFFNGKSNEEGNMVLGLRNHIEVLNELNEADYEKINIAIGHHGIDCFCKEERDDIIYNFLDNKVDMYLCGHVHDGNYGFYNKDLIEFPVLTSGALMLDGYAKATFLTGEIDLDEKKCLVQYHSWINDIKQWDLDNTIGRRIKNQKLDFELERFKKKVI